MRNTFFSLISVALFCVGALFAQPPHAGFAPNEDLQYIREHMHAQKAAELAGVLALSETQVAQLRETRAAADLINAQNDPLIDAAVEALNVAAAEIRAALEAGNELTEAQGEQLKTLKRAVHEAHHTKRGEMRDVMESLRDFLTEAQRESLHAFMEANRPERPEGGEGAEGEGGPEGRRGRGPGFGRGGDHGGRGQGPRGQGPRGGIAKILLSDAFLSQYN